MSIGNRVRHLLNNYTKSEWDGGSDFTFDDLHSLLREVFLDRIPPVSEPFSTYPPLYLCPCQPKRELVDRRGLPSVNGSLVPRNLQFPLAKVHLICY